MITRAHVRVDPEAGAHNALAGRYPARVLRPDAPLARELAFAVGDDDLEALTPGAQGLAQRVGHTRHAIGAYAPDPQHAHALQGCLDVEALAAAVRSSLLERMSRWPVALA